MLVTLELPDSIAHALTDHCDRAIERQLLDALAVDGYREQRLTQKQVGKLLGLSRIQTEDFLAAHVDLYDYDPSELAREAEQLRDFFEQQR